MLHWAIVSNLDINDRPGSLKKEIETFQQGNKRYKEEHVENLDPENTITKIKKALDGFSSRIEMREKWVNLKMKQQKLSNLKDNMKHWKKRTVPHGPIK